MIHFYIYCVNGRTFILEDEEGSTFAFSSEHAAADMAIRFAQDCKVPYSIDYARPGR